MTPSVRIDAILALINAGIPIVANIVGAIKANKLQVTGAAGEVLTAEQVTTACDAAIAHALAIGDFAADRVEGRG